MAAAPPAIHSSTCSIVAALIVVQRLLRRLRVLSDHGQATPAGAAVERGQPRCSRCRAAARGSIPIPRHDPGRPHLPGLPGLGGRCRVVLRSDGLAHRAHPGGSDPGRRADDRVPADHAPHRPRQHRGRRAGAEDAGVDASPSALRSCSPGRSPSWSACSAPSYGSSSLSLGRARPRARRQGATAGRLPVDRGAEDAGRDRERSRAASSTTRRR